MLQPEEVFLGHEIDQFNSNSFMNAPAFWSGDGNHCFARAFAYHRHAQPRGEAMADARYFVIQQDDQWMIKFADEQYGPYKSRSEAMLFAIDAAQKLGERGGDAQVHTMGENDRSVPQWIYGRDPYPPRL
jgi:hypothetical protein